jgi:hypothetical protein
MEARNARLILEGNVVADEVLQLTPAIQVGRKPREDASTVGFWQPAQRVGSVMQRTPSGHHPKNGRPE